MNAINWKKLLLPNIPYLLFVYLFDKVGQAVRLAPGADLSGKVLSLGEGFSMAFACLLYTSLRDLGVGLLDGELDLAAVVVHDGPVPLDDFDGAHGVLLSLESFVSG